MPPLEAWKAPEKWLDTKTGKARRDIERIVPAVDDRGLIKIHELVETVNETFFHKDYDWPYSPDDPTTRPDDHHFYFTANTYRARENNDSLIPLLFRNLPVHIGWMPRQFHTTIHDFVEIPTKPCFDVMADFVQSYNLAHNVFLRLIKEADLTKEASAQFKSLINDDSLSKRSLSRRSKQVKLEFMRSFFEEHFSAYSESVNTWQEMPVSEKQILSIPEISSRRPKDVIRKLGKYATKRHIDFVELLKTA